MGRKKNLGGEKMGKKPDTFVCEASELTNIQRWTRNVHSNYSKSNVFPNYVASHVNVSPTHSPSISLPPPPPFGHTGKKVFIFRRKNDLILLN